MVFTISPTEAQAMQEDEMQLISAIAQATRGAVALAMLKQPPDNQPPEALRIQMGRRVVYGWLHDGQFRNELNPDCLKTIFDAIQRPVTEGTDAAQYRGKIPAIEIRDGETILFREERDGTVTVNAIQFQLEQNVPQQSAEAQVQKTTQFQPDLSQTAPQPEPSIAPTARAATVAQTADYLLNPLGEEQPIYDSVAIGEYRIKQGHNSIVTVSRGDALILVAKDGEVITDNVTEQDWQAFQAIQARFQPQQLDQETDNETLPQETIEEELPDQEYHSLYELWEDLEKMAPAELLAIATERFGLYPEGKDPVELENNLLAQHDVIQDILAAYKSQQENHLDRSPSTANKDRTAELPRNEDQVTLTADVAEATAPQNVLPAIAVAERETAKLPDNTTKQLLQFTLQDWKQQLQRRLEKGFRQGRNWLSTRPENWRNQRVARATLELFNRGYERTGERSYQIGELTISFRGRNLYTLKDTRGELMRFQASRVALPGVGLQSVKVLATSDRLTDFQCRDLQTMRQNRSMTPQGDLDVEANYVARTSRVERTVIQFLQTRAKANLWDKEGGKFRLEMGAGGDLCIADKQEGRGIVFQRQNGEVFSKLNVKDFAHFDRLAAKMQQSQQQDIPSRQVRSNIHSLQKSSGLELA